MKMNVLKAKTRLLKWSFAALAAFGVVACSEKIDDSDLMTATGDTVESFIEKDEDLTKFNYILKRVGLDRLMASYGTYTCFAPINSAIDVYVDSLYNDTAAVVPHNGMEYNSYEALTDSLCEDIARYHLTSSIYNIITINGGATIRSMIGRDITPQGADSLGRSVLNECRSTIISEDNEVINGMVHKIDKVLFVSSLVLGEELARHEDFSLFFWALERTGLIDSIAKTRKDATYTLVDNLDTPEASSVSLYYPKECKLGFTIFAESDAVFRANGVNDTTDLINKANELYGGSVAWYDYAREKNWTISTGKDYTNRNNALNMFVAYHILYAKMAADRLVFENQPGVAITTSKWSYVNGGEPHDYYETMLPHTLMKIWQPQPGRINYINRYQTNNTLTNTVGEMGTNHELVDPGIRIERTGGVIADNGYVHPINGILSYHENVPKGVLNERMRFDSSSFLEELINNGYRYMYPGDVSKELNDGGSGNRIAFATDFFDDIVCINGDRTQLRYNVKAQWWAHEADIFQGWGYYDLAVRLPPVPTGTYELRITYAIMADKGGFMQFYYGTEPNPQKMTALGIPLDARLSGDDPSIGYTLFYNEEDRGLASDEAMRLRGYMRGPYAFTGHPGEGGYEPTTNGSCRGNNQSVRRILGTIDVKQSEDLWLRIKDVLGTEQYMKWQIDYVELVPKITVIDNDQYTEDWY